MKQLHCEWCGHDNPPGTELCQACGKPFVEDEGILNMRYEGAARRSQTHRRTLVDRIWNFFASVKVGVWLLFITLVASAIGTLYPQQMYIPSTADPAIYYAEEYGVLGEIYVLLGFHNLYSSWWYVLLLILIGISLIVASIDRGIPLYKSLKGQRVRRHPAFMRRQRIGSEAELRHVSSVESVFQRAEAFLKKKGYRVRRDGQALLAEKGRFSRSGPYIVHVGLIILLAGAMIRITLPGITMDDYVWVRDGETVPIHATNGQYHIKSEGFALELYDEPHQDRLVPEQFITEAVLFEQVIGPNGEATLEEVKRQTIMVNQPMTHDNLRIYQSDYILNEFSRFSFDIAHKQTGDVVGVVDVDLYEPEQHYELGNGFEVRLIEYYPDFEFDRNNQPGTASNIPNNPAFIFELRSPELEQPERSWIFVGQRIESPDAEHQYEFNISDVRFSNVTGLLISKERSLPIIYVGLAIAMIGLVLCFYWQHRRIWIQQEEEDILVAAHTNKNWFGLRKEVEGLLDRTELPVDRESLDKEDDANGSAVV